MSIPNNEQINNLNKLTLIEPSDTLSTFVKKCNDNFTAISTWSGIPNGKQGTPGASGSPTKPKVPIHIWKIDEDYSEETEDKIEGFKIKTVKTDLTKPIYQEGHLILLENGHVYKLVVANNNSLYPEYSLSLHFSIKVNDGTIKDGDLNDFIQTKIGEINKAADTAKSNIEEKVNEINTLQSGGQNLLDRTEFEIYNPIDSNDTNPKTYIITKKDPITRNFSFIARDLDNVTFEINNKSKDDNNLLTNSLIIDTSNSKLKDGKINEKYSDVSQTLTVTEGGVNYTILKPETKYTLQCKYRCKINTDIIQDPNAICGALYITFSNPSWMNVDGVDKQTYSDSRVFLYETNDTEWKPLVIKIKTGENVGKKDNKPNGEIMGCGLYIRSMMGSTIEICELKLEEGDIHTSWSPSLADISSKTKTSCIYITDNNKYNYLDKDNNLNINNCYYTINTLILIETTNGVGNIILPSKNNINNGYVVRIKYIPNKTYTVQSNDGSRLIGINSRTSSGYITVENSYSEFTYFGGGTWCQTK